MWDDGVWITELYTSVLVLSFLFTLHHEHKVVIFTLLSS